MNSGSIIKKRKPATERGVPSPTVEEVAPSAPICSEGKNPDPSAAVEEMAPAEASTRQPTDAAALCANTHWLTRIVFIRSLAFVYCEYVECQLE